MKNPISWKGLLAVFFVVGAIQCKSRDGAALLSNQNNVTVQFDKTDALVSGSPAQVIKVSVFRRDSLQQYVFLRSIFLTKGGSTGIGLQKFTQYRFHFDLFDSEQDAMRADVTPAAQSVAGSDVCPDIDNVFRNFQAVVKIVVCQGSEIPAESALVGGSSAAKKPSRAVAQEQAQLMVPHPQLETEYQDGVGKIIIKQGKNATIELTEDKNKCDGDKCSARLYQPETLNPQLTLNEPEKGVYIFRLNKKYFVGVSGSPAIYTLYKPALDLSDQPIGDYKDWPQQPFTISTKLETVFGDFKVAKITGYFRYKLNSLRYILYIDSNNHQRSVVFLLQSKVKYYELLDMLGEQAEKCNCLAYEDAGHTIKINLDYSDAGYQVTKIKYKGETAKAVNSDIYQDFEMVESPQFPPNENGERSELKCEKFENPVCQSDEEIFYPDDKTNIGCKEQGICKPKSAGCSVPLTPICSSGQITYQPQNKDAKGCQYQSYCVEKNPAPVTSKTFNLGISGYLENNGTIRLYELDDGAWRAVNNKLPTCGSFSLDGKEFDEGDCVDLSVCSEIPSPLEIQIKPVEYKQESPRNYVTIPIANSWKFEIDYFADQVDQNTCSASSLQTETLEN